MEIVLVDNFGKKEARDLMILLQDEGIFTYPKEPGYGSFQRVEYRGNLEDRYAIILTNHDDSSKAQEIPAEFRKQWNKKNRSLKWSPKCGQKRINSCL
jgi:hypothetical protein